MDEILAFLEVCKNSLFELKNIGKYFYKSIMGNLRNSLKEN